MSIQAFTYDPAKAEVDGTMVIGAMYWAGASAMNGGEQLTRLDGARGVTITKDGESGARYFMDFEGIGPLRFSGLVSDTLHTGGNDHYSIVVTSIDTAARRISFRRYRDNGGTESNFANDQVFYFVAIVKEMSVNTV